MHERSPTTIRHQAESDMLRQAVDGDATATLSVLQYLSSANRYLRQIMLESVHDCGSTPEDQAARLWDKLLHCLAQHCWEGLPDSQRLADPVARQRIDESIQAAFLQNESSNESSIEERVKEAVLQAGLASEESEVRAASAYLLGLSGDARAIPVLAWLVEHGNKEWQLRALQALGEIKDVRSGYPVLLALRTDDAQVHHGAKHALSRLDRAAEPALEEALNHQDSHIRWHAARALGEIGNPGGVQHLTEGLLDENEAVRWATADVLARLDAAAVPAILHQLTNTPLTEQYCQAAYHALHAMPSRQTQERLQPLLKALQSPAHRVEAPVAAQRLLITWQEA